MDTPKEPAVGPTLGDAAASGRIAGIALAAAPEGWRWEADVYDLEHGHHQRAGKATGDHRQLAVHHVVQHIAASHWGMRTPSKGWSFQGQGRAAAPNDAVAQFVRDGSLRASVRLRRHPLMASWVKRRNGAARASGFGPFIVGADASLMPGGAATWACVTGAGWQAAGSVPDEVTGGRNSICAETVAIAQAVGMFPRGCDITVINDNAEAVRAARALASGAPFDEVYRSCGWLPPGPPKKDGTPLHMLFRVLQISGDVTVEWAARNTHRLQRAAHHGAGTAQRRLTAGDSVLRAVPGSDRSGPPV